MSDTIEKCGVPGLHIYRTVSPHPNPNEHQMHAHEFCELFYFSDGAGSYSVEGHEYPLVPNSILLMRIGETHMLHIRPELPYERFVVNFQPEMLSAIDPSGRMMEPYLNRASGQRNLYTPTQFNVPLVRGCLNAMLTAAGRSAYMQRLAILTNLSAILYELCRVFRSDCPPETDTAPQSLIAGVVDYINRNLTEELSLDALSARFFLSKSYLNQQFRQATGTTIWDYVLLKRLMRTRTAIRSGVPVTDAFRASGFNDYSSFYRRYKSRFGVSPKEDRPHGN